jgi:membrane protein involved in colicin uptake
MSSPKQKKKRRLVNKLREAQKASQKAVADARAAAVKAAAEAKAAAEKAEAEARAAAEKAEEEIRAAAEKAKEEAKETVSTIGSFLTGNKAPQKKTRRVARTREG